METIHGGLARGPNIVKDLYPLSCCRPDKAKLATERDGKSIPEQTLGRT
jgi:hypothetical protein